MSSFIDRFLIYMQIKKSISNATLLAYKTDLLQLEKKLNDLFNCKLEDANINQLMECFKTFNLKSSSYNRKISTYHDFYNYLVKQNIKLSFDVCDISRVKKEKIYPRIIKKDDIGKMISVCDNNIIGKRNKTIIMMLYITGLRVSELINLTFNDINIKDGYIRVLGKGNKERILIVGDLLNVVLTPYLNDVRKEILKGLPSKYLFVGSDGFKLRRETIFKIIKKCAKKANIMLNVTPHTLRHCFATHMLENGADIRSIQEMLGHANITTTQIYTNITNEAIKKAYFEGFKDDVFNMEENYMTTFKRAFVIVCDSLGIGSAKDAKTYNDEGADTLKHINDYKPLNIPELRSLGLAHISNINRDDTLLDHCYAFAMNEISNGKDTLTGHYELMGLKVDEPFKTFTETGFPDDLIKQLENLWNRKIIGNKAASGTEIIKELGEEHLKTGNMIVYTSSDSVLQVCGHEDIVSVNELYKMCEQAREITKKDPYKLGRIIARPFIGSNPSNFKRTPRRHDYALKPFDKTLLNNLKDAGYDVISIGKIVDIFDNEGITKSTKIVNNQDGCEKIIETIKQDFRGLCFANLVDFDMEYGHRRNIAGYHNAIEDFDVYLKIFKELLTKDDILFITADHGNDPSWSGNDHTREKVPLLIYSKAFKNTGILQESDTFADLSSTLADIFKVSPTKIGKSRLKELN